MSDQDRSELPDGFAEEEDAFRLFDGRQSPIAAAVQRGCSRLLGQMAYAPVTELTLSTGRRADMVGIGLKGEIIIIEIKSSLADFRADGKWGEYLDFCDRFYFAVPPEFPRDALPAETGLIIADRYGAEIVREGPENKLNAARRKAMTLHVARVSARRVTKFLDPER